MTNNEKEIAKWNQFSVQGTKLMKRTIPNIRRGAGLDTIFQQEFSLYPSRYTREWRERINTATREATGLQPFIKKRKQVKPKPRRTFFLGENKGRRNADQGLLSLSQTITNQTKR